MKYVSQPFESGGESRVDEVKPDIFKDWVREKILNFHIIIFFRIILISRCQTHDEIYPNRVVENQG